MNTDALVAALARSATPVDRAAVTRRFWVTLLAAAVLSLGMMLVVLGPRADWRAAMDLPMFWVKLAFPAAMAVAAFICLRRLGHPGMRLGGGPVAVTLPAVVMWLIAAAALAAAPAPQRAGLVMGTSWWQCVVLISMLALPGFVLGLFAMAALAPTRLALSGFMAGLFAGSVAAFAYALSCKEMQPPFLATWYLLGMLVPALAGAVVGRAWLRW